MGHWEQDAAVFAEWRLDMVKMDFVRIPWLPFAEPLQLTRQICSAQCHWPASIPDTPFQQAYANMSAALNATGRAIHFNMCEWGVANPWEWGPALAQVISLAEELGKWATSDWPLL